MSAVRFSIPLTPPSVNHYAKHTRSGRHYLTAEARAFKDAVVILAPKDTTLWAGLTRSQLRKLRYELEARVYFGKGQRGDGDNLWKCIPDGLKDAGIIHSDAAVSDWILRVRRDAANPRTEIRVEVVR